MNKINVGNQRDPMRLSRFPYQPIFVFVFTGEFSLESLGRTFVLAAESNRGDIKTFRSQYAGPLYDLRAAADLPAYSKRCTELI